MDRVINGLETIVREEIVEYNRASGYKTTGYYFESPDQHAYAWIIVPDSDHPLANQPDIVVMARVTQHHVVIERDATDRPLYAELLRRGIPREQIVLAYAGETQPE